MRLLAVAAWLGVSSITACGDDAVDGAGASDGDAGSGGGGGEPAHDYLDLPHRTGTITIFESYVEHVRETNLIGAFLDIDQGTPGACADETFRGCTVTFCKSGAVPRDALVDAGGLEIDFGGGTAPSVTHRNDVTGFYLATLVSDELIETGREVAISTSGRDVPTFATALEAPPLVTLTSEVPVEGGRISTVAPFELAWTADDDQGSLDFVLRVMAVGENATLTCSFDVAAGAAEVPAEALAQLAAVDSVQSMTLEIETSSTTQLVAGDFAVSVGIIVTALAGSGDAVRTISGLD